MPGLQNQSAKQRIRIIYTDPEATDCSSDDENEGWNKARNSFDGTKRLVKEVCVFSNREESCCRTVNEPPIDGKVRNAEAKLKHPGVRMRPWGKWVAEIRDPSTGKKNWLGTFFSEDEAASAYQKKKHEYQKLRQIQPARNSISEASTSEEINTNVMISLPSPSSVLDAPITNTLGGFPCLNEAEYQDTSIEELYLGNDTEHLVDGLRVENLTMEESNDFDARNFSNIDNGFPSSDIAGADGLVNNPIEELYLGNDTEQLVDLRAENLTMGESNDVDERNFSNIDIDFYSSDIAWKDGLVNNPIEELYLGNDTEHLADDLKVENLTMEEPNDVDVRSFSNIDTGFPSSDIAWADGLINTPSEYDSHEAIKAEDR